MQNHLTKKTTSWLLVGLTLLSFFFRFLSLGSVPVALSHDETDNIIQAHAVIQTGSDINRTWNPWSLLPNSGVMAELGPLINVPALSLLPQSPFASRVTSAFLSSLFPLILYFLLINLEIANPVALTSAFLLSISPWHILFSRSALEQPTSLFFYVLSWLLLTLLFRSKKRLSFVLYALFFVLSYGIGFLTYHGYKFSLPILTLLLTGFLTYSRRGRRAYGIALGVLLVIGSLFLHTYLHRDLYTSRSSEIIFSQGEKIAGIVNGERKQSLGTLQTKTIFSNKYSYLLGYLENQYAGIFSPSLLFLTGESTGVFSTGETGYLLLMLAPFILLGLLYLLRSKKGSAYLLVSLLLLSPITSVIQNNTTYSFRSALFFVLLHVLAAAGLVGSYPWFKRLAWQIRWLLGTLLIVGFLSGVSYFTYVYFSIYPVTSADAYTFGDRTLANYVRLSQGTGAKILIIDWQPRYIYSAIILAKGSVDAAAIASFGGHYSPSDDDIYQVDNLTVTHVCPKTGEYDTIIARWDIVAGLDNCPIAVSLMKRTPKPVIHSLASPLDSHEERRIISDTLCSDNEVKSYVHPTALADFALEKMNKAQFCSTWVTKQ